MRDTATGQTAQHREAGAKSNAHTEAKLQELEATEAGFNAGGPVNPYKSKAYQRGQRARMRSDAQAQAEEEIWTDSEIVPTTEIPPDTQKQPRWLCILEHWLQ